MKETELWKILAVVFLRRVPVSLLSQARTDLLFLGFQCAPPLPHWLFGGGDQVLFCASV